METAKETINQMAQRKIKLFKDFCIEVSPNERKELKRIFGLIKTRAGIDIFCRPIVKGEKTVYQAIQDFKNFREVK